MGVYEAGWCERQISASAEFPLLAAETDRVMAKAVLALIEIKPRTSSDKRMPLEFVTKIFLRFCLFELLWLHKYIVDTTHRRSKQTDGKLSSRSAAC